jgi:lambda repressor-like predicted transcriptional regulator
MNQKAKYMAPADISTAMLKTGISHSEIAREIHVHPSAVFW